MDDELESGRGRRLIPDDPSSSNAKALKQWTYTQVFEKAFPEYLALGMDYDQYWNQDAALVKAYRRAHELRREERNFELWLQGRYIYDAIAALAPILRASFGKKAVKAEKYTERPYPLTQDAAEKAQDDRQKSRMLAALERFKQEAELNRLRREKEARKHGE